MNGRPVIAWKGELISEACDRGVIAEGGWVAVPAVRRLSNDNE